MRDGAGRDPPGPAGTRRPAGRAQQQRDRYLRAGTCGSAARAPQHFVCVRLCVRDAAETNRTRTAREPTTRKHTMSPENEI